MSKAVEADQRAITFLPSSVVSQREQLTLSQGELIGTARALVKSLSLSSSNRVCVAPPGGDVVSTLVSKCFFVFDHSPFVLIVVVCLCSDGMYGHGRLHCDG